MSCSRIVFFTGLAGMSLLSSSPSAFAHGDHAPAEGVMHVVAHFVQTMDQPVLFACALGLMVLAINTVKAVLHRKKAD